MFYHSQTHFTFNICQRYICLYILQSQGKNINYNLLCPPELCPEIAHAFTAFNILGSFQSLCLYIEILASVLRYKFSTPKK